MSELTAKQTKFCYEYANCGNATQSAINAGYAEKTAYSQGQRLLKKDYIQSFLKALTDEYSTDKIASATEVQERLTEIIRGEALEEVIVVVGTGEGRSEAVTKTKGPSTRDVIRAIETLAKMQGLFREDPIVNLYLPVFTGENDLEG